MLNERLGTLLMAALTFCVVAANAQTTIFTESFETPNTADNSDPLGTPAGWTWINRANTINQGLYNDTAGTITTYGSQFLYVYTSSGFDIRTTDAILNETVELGAEYQVSLKYCGLRNDRGISFTVKLLAIDGADNATELGTHSVDLGNGHGLLTLVNDFSFSVTPSSKAGERLAIEISKNTSGDHNFIDNLVLTKTVSGVSVTPDYVTSNAVPGTLVGALHDTDPAVDAFGLADPTGNDNSDFMITGDTNLRTRVWMDAASKLLSVISYSNNTALATNDVVVVVSNAPSGYAAFEVRAEVKAGEVVGTPVIGALLAHGSAPATFDFAITGGRTDLFEIDGTGTNVVQVAGSDPGIAGSLHYLSLQATNATAAVDLVVGVEVVSGVPNGTLFLFQ